MVDFADIQDEFGRTKVYCDGLVNEFGDDLSHYSNLFKPARGDPAA